MTLLLQAMEFAAQNFQLHLILMKSGIFLPIVSSIVNKADKTDTPKKQTEPKWNFLRYQIESLGKKAKNMPKKGTKNWMDVA